MLHGLVIKCSYTVVYEASIHMIYSCSNVFFVFWKILDCGYFLWLRVKEDENIAWFINFVKVFLHSTLRRSSRVVSSKVSSASQYDKLEWMMDIALIVTLSMSCTRLSVRLGCQTWQAYSRIEWIRLWKVTSRSASSNTLLLSTLIIQSFRLALMMM